MIDLRLYRLCFAPALLAVIVIMFSLDGIPSPVEPATPPATFDGERAAAQARQIARLAPDRRPGSEGDARVADLVRDRFEEIPAGAVSEQAFEADVDGEGTSLRNVVLTLLGDGDETVVVVAARDSPRGPGAASSAAGTGLLLELARSLGVAGHERTFVLASTSGGGTAGRGVSRLLAALPDPEAVEAVIVVSQPGSSEPRPEYVITSSTGDDSGSIQLRRTAELAVESQAQRTAQGAGAFTQLARLAIPSGLGAQAPLIAAGIDAVAISSAGERPLDPGADQLDDLSPATLDAFGRSVQATVAAIDTASTDLVHGPGAYVKLADNLVPGWTLALLALTLILPAVVVSIDACARGLRGGLDLGSGLAWGAARALPLIGALAMLYALGFAGAIPRPGFPFDPGLHGPGTGATIALAAIVVAALATAVLLRARHLTGAAAPAVALPALGAIGALACVLIWLANPYLALLVAPAAHVWLLGGLRPGPARAGLVAVGAAVACLPPIAALAAVAGALDLGGAAPWTFAIMVADGQLGLALTAPACFLGGALLGTVAIAVAPRPDPDG